jgi:predicted Rdx family selenoprotein
LQQRGAQDVHLVQGGRGVFDIRLDGAVAYSKAHSGRFPTDAEVDALLPGA